jgi:hypothetical protein
VPQLRGPCDLVPIFKILGKIDGYDYCEDKQGVETFSKEISSLRKSIVSLLAAASSGLVELKKAVEQKRDKKKAKDRPGSCNPSPLKKSKVDARKADLFERLGAVAQVARVATEGAWESSQWDSLQIPLLVTSGCLKKAMPFEADLAAITDKSGQMATTLAETRTNFLAKFEEQKQPLRAMQAIENRQVEEAARKLLPAVLPYPDIIDTSKAPCESEATNAYENRTQGG